LVLLSGAGDEISSMKRGVLEAADVIAFNKADGERLSSVESDASSLRASLTLSRGARVPPVLVVSAQQETGVRELWNSLCAQHDEANLSGSFSERRAQQRFEWFQSALEEELQDALAHRPGAVAARRDAEASVADGSASPWEAAQRLVATLLPEPDSSDR